MYAHCFWRGAARLLLAYFWKLAARLLMAACAATRMPARPSARPSFTLLAAAGCVCVNFEMRGAGSGLWQPQRHRDECSFPRHR